jgi:hypothetical protein
MLVKYSTPATLTGLFKEVYAQSFDEFWSINRENDAFYVQKY